MQFSWWSEIDGCRQDGRYNKEQPHLATLCTKAPEKRLEALSDCRKGKSRRWLSESIPISQIYNYPLELVRPCDKYRFDWRH